MQLRPEQLAALLAQLDRPLAPLYLLHGDEPLLVIEAADAIRAAARKQGFEEREVIVVGTEIDRAHQELLQNMNSLGAAVLAGTSALTPALLDHRPEIGRAHV